MTSRLHVPSRSHLLLPVAAVAVIVVVVVAVVVDVSASHSGTGSARPPVLHLSTVANGSGGLAALSPAAAVGQVGAGGGSNSGTGWQLAASLPATPSPSPVYLLPAGPLTSAFVHTLASALGMHGAARHLRGGWYLASGNTELSVSELAGRHWSYSDQGCLAGPALDPQTAAVCAVAAPPISSAPGASVAPGVGGVTAPTAVPVPIEQAPVSVAIARAVAAPVLRAVGVDPDTASVQTAGSQRSVVDGPQVAGQAVLGLQTTVSLNSRGQIVNASGWLATPIPGARYPLISARKGYDELLAQPEPMMAQALICRRIPGGAGCAPMSARVVTGARLGLTQTFSTDRAVLLVPAWLFQVRGDSTPMAVIAVQQAFLTGPEQPVTVGRASTGSVPGSTGAGGGTSTSSQHTGAAQMKSTGPATVPAPVPAP